MPFPAGISWHFDLRNPSESNRTEVSTPYLQNLHLSTESPVSTPWLSTHFRWERLQISGVPCYLIAPTTANGTTNAELPYLAQLFTEIQVQGDYLLQVVSMFHVIIPWSIMWFKKEYFEAPSKWITRKMRQLEYVFHPNQPCKRHGFEIMKVSEGRIAAAMHCYIIHLTSQFKIGNGQGSTLAMQTYL